MKTVMCAWFPKAFVAVTLLPVVLVAFGAPVRPAASQESHPGPQDCFEGPHEEDASQRTTTSLAGHGFEVGNL